MTAILARAGNLRSIAQTAATSYRYLRMQITANQPGGAGEMQFSELQYLDSGGNVLTGATVTSPITPSGSGTNGGEDVTQINDGNTGTKWTLLGFGSGPAAALFTYPTAVAAVSYRWATANDVSGRDPYTFFIEGSNDNSTWTRLDTVTQQTASTNARNTYQPTRPLTAAT